MTTPNFFLLFFFFIFSFSCKQEPLISPGDSYPREILLSKQSSPEIQIPSTNSRLDDVPNFGTTQNLTLAYKILSGKIDESTGGFSKLGGYIQFRDNLQKNWNSYHSGILNPFKDWLLENFPDPYEESILYPFSGPDIANAITIYPKASKYILIGLEPGGTVPPFDTDTDEKKIRGLQELNSSMDSISRLNFFLTNKMKINITGAIYPGTTPVILAYLGLLGMEPKSVKSFLIETNGEMRYLSEAEKASNSQYIKGNYCSEIQFLEPKTGVLKTVYYISANVSNQGLEKDPGILAFLKKRGPFSSTMKAASYLLHNEAFKTFRDFILENVGVLVMDDTGPRIRDLNQKFMIQVYGIYTRPIGLFPNNFQPELRDLHAQQKPKPIPFKYGYGTLHRTQHLIIARKKKD